MNILKYTFTLFLSIIVLFSCSGSRISNKDEIDDITVNDKVVTVYVTTNTRSLEFVKQEIPFSEKADNMSPLTINLIANQTYQIMDGFGAAITGSTAYNLLQMQKLDRDKFLNETFSEKGGAGYSYVRIAIGCSDFSLSEYTCCDKEGLENFALQSEELEYVIPILKEILTINPNIKVMGSPWTAPLWMKVNNLKDLTHGQVVN